MKKLSVLFIVFLATFSLQAQIDTTISYYDFNNLIPGNMAGQDSWVTTLTGTTTDIQIETGYSHDGTNAAHFTKTGGNVNASANRPLNTIFPDFNYADSAVYFLYFDMIREYWGTEFGLAYDYNQDGVISMANNVEKGLRFKTAQNGGCWLYTPDGNTHTNATLINSGWNRIEIKLETGANNGQGSLSIRYKAIGTTTWFNLFVNVNAGLNPSVSDPRNPALWDQVFFHFTGQESGLDNLEFWRIAHIIIPPNHDPTDIGLAPDTISENQPPYRLIGLLSTVDPDTNDTHQYSLVAGTGDTDNAYFVISNDSLFSSISFNYEDTSMRYIRIMTEDPAGASFEKAFVINIIDVSEVNPGINELSDDQLYIYPNPAKEKLFIEFKNGIQDGIIKMYTTNGLLVREEKYQGSAFELNVSDVINGNYILVLEYEKGKFLSRKIQILK